MNRRGVLTRIVQAFGLTGFAFLTYPFIRAWIPTFSQDLEVNVKDLLPGQSKQVHWLGRNLHILRRRPETISLLTRSGNILKDPGSEDSTQPGFARNDYRSLRPEIFVAYSNCTHLGCEVSTSGSTARFNCPCHLSEYDAAGRVHKGAVAPANLEVPDYQFVSQKSLLLVKRT